MAEQDVTVELYYSSAWNDITSDVYARDEIAITRGRANEQSEAAPSTAELTIGNTSGDYNPRNPASGLYGKIGRNTPIRVSLGTGHPGDTDVDISSGTDHAAPALTSPSDDAVLVCAWANEETSGSYTLPGGMTDPGVAQQGTGGTIDSGHETIAASGSTGTRTATYSTSTPRGLMASALVSGTSVAVQETIGDSSGTMTTGSGTQRGWWMVLVAYFAWDDDTLVVPELPDDDDGGGWIELGDTAAAGFTSTNIRIKTWIKQVRTGGAFDVRLTTDITARSQLYLISGGGLWQRRFTGEVSSWTPRRSLDGSDAWVEVSAAGVGRRYGQGADSLASAPYRWVTQQDPGSYWPMDEGRGASRLRSVSGGVSMRVDEEWAKPGEASQDVAPWMAQMVQLVVEENELGTMSTSATSASGQAVAVDWLFADTDGPHNNLTVEARLGNGDRWLWELDGDADTLTVSLYNSLGALQDSGSDSGGTGSLRDGDLHHVRLLLEQDGSDIDYSVWVDGSELTLDDNTAASRLLASVAAVEISWEPGASTNQEPGTMAFGHLAVWSGSSAPSLSDAVDAAFGWANESGGDRLARLADEEGLTFAVVGDPDATQPMGPQYPDDLLTILREVAATDGGVLVDSRGQNTFQLRTGRSRYSQTAALALDFDAGELAPPLEPAVDDVGIRNDVTATRRDGASARAVRSDGPLSTSMPPDGVGRYDTSVTVNPWSDGVVGDHAGWRLHLGSTVDELRVPQITVDLSANPDMADAAGNVDVGDRITVDNLPAEVTPDLLSLVVQGYRETIGTHRRTITYNCAAEAVLHIGEVGHDDYSYLGSAGSTKDFSAFTSGTSTSLGVVVADGYPLWDDGDAPFDILVDGVRLTVTAVSGTSSPQTLTVDATPVNGVVKLLSGGAKVDLFCPSYIGL